jgi:hypothetical protein
MTKKQGSDGIVYFDPIKGENVSLAPKGGDAPIEYTKDEAVKELWTLGILSWKLHKAQLDIYEAVQKSDSQKFIINCSRRLGKSYCLCLMAIEYAMQHPNVRVCYAAPTAKAVKKIITPIFNEILSDCPGYLRPKWSAQDQVYRFPNGSEIHIAGTDAERAESLRGQSMHLGICDEAAFMDQLDYVVSDILMPQTLTTDGRIILASTPPKSPGHYFKTYADEAEPEGNYIKKTIYDNPMVTKKRIIKFMMETDKSLSYEKAEEYYKIKSGPPNVTWRREYMAEFLKDENLAVIPEFNDESALDIIKDVLVVPPPLGQDLPPNQVVRPPFYDAYVGLDIGFNDFTVALFGYWDFLDARLVIEEEVVMNRMTTETLANAIKMKELQLWVHKKPYMRYSDTDLIVINDLQVLHNLTFTPTKKDNKEAAINNVRMLVANKQLVISPKCKYLIAHLKSAVWNKSKTSFERSGDHGHYDAVDALIYLSRNVQRNRNPVPPGHGMNIQTQFVPPNSHKSKVQLEFQKIFNLKKHFGRWPKD